MANLTKGTYRQRSRFLGKLRNKYKDISIEDRDTSEAKKMLVEINDLDKELKGIANSVGTRYIN